MNNFLISIVCGVIFAVELTAMYLGWASIKRFGSSRVFDGGFLFLLMLCAYKTAVKMACELILQFGVINNDLVQGLLFVPVALGILTSAGTLWIERHPHNRIFS